MILVSNLLWTETLYVPLPLHMFVCFGYTDLLLPSAAPSLPSVHVMTVNIYSFIIFNWIYVSFCVTSPTANYCDTALGRTSQSHTSMDTI